jgi:hypothetical protein
MKRKTEDTCHTIRKYQKIEAIRITEIYLYNEIFSYVPFFDCYKNIALVSKNFKKVMDKIMMEYIYNTTRFFPIQRKIIEINPIIEYFSYINLSKNVFSGLDPNMLLINYGMMKKYESTSTDMMSFQEGGGVILSNEHFKCEELGPDKIWEKHNYFNKLYKSIQTHNFEIINGSLCKIRKDLEQHPIIDTLIRYYDAVIAGSCVLYHVLNCPSNWKYGDIDVWMDSAYYDQVCKLITKYGFIIQYIDYTYIEEYVLDTSSIYFMHNEVKIQVIFHQKHLSFVVDNFDIDICKCIYDGRDVRLGFDVAQLKKKEFQLNPKRIDFFNEKRIKKYKDRGFTLKE